MFRDVHGVGVPETKTLSLIQQTALPLRHWLGRTLLSTGEGDGWFRAGLPARLDVIQQGKTSQGSIMFTSWAWHLVVSMWLEDADLKHGWTKSPSPTIYLLLIKVVNSDTFNLLVISSGLTTAPNCLKPIGIIGRESIYPCARKVAMCNLCRVSQLFRT